MRASHSNILAMVDAMLQRKREDAGTAYGLADYAGIKNGISMYVRLEFGAEILCRQARLCSAAPRLHVS